MPRCGFGLGVAAQWRKLCVRSDRKRSYTLVRTHTCSEEVELGLERGLPWHMRLYFQYVPRWKVTPVLKTLKYAQVSLSLLKLLPSTGVDITQPTE